MTEVPPAELSFAESVCLALIDQQVSYGWALGTVLAPDGEVGRIWSLTRPLTYRAVDGLVDKSLVRRGGQVAGRGRDRVLLSPTRAGRRAVERWLDTPVEHVRDVRTELLVKIYLRQRAGLDLAPLLTAQLAQFEPAIDALTSVRPEDDLVALWRRESALAVRRFLEQAIRHSAGSPPPRPDVAALADRAQLRQLVEQYARAADDRDAARFADVFTDDAILHTATGRVTGRQQLLTIAPKLAKYRVTMHLVANHDVELAIVDGAPADSATGAVYCEARHVYEEGGVERVYVMHIRYDDRYRRLGDGWRIAERRLNLLWDEDHPLR